MGNMSYCRFQNTERDLRECVEVLEELLYGDGGTLSDDELRAANRLIGLCIQATQMIRDETGKEPDEILDASSSKQEHFVGEVLATFRSNSTEEGGEK